MKVLVFKDIKNKRWTLWTLDRKTHLGYKDELFMKDCSFIVVEEKREKVVKNKRRFPHAWVIGEVSQKEIKKSFTTEISYNPFENKNFVKKKINKPIKKSKQAFFSSQGQVFI